MKKLLLLSIMICYCFNALAQNESQENRKATDKGNFIVDGSFQFSINNSKSEQGAFDSRSDAFSFGLSPKAAYFVIDKMAIGLEISYNYFESEVTIANGSSSKGKSNAISIGPFFRYYLTNGIFGQANLGLGTSNGESNGVRNEDRAFSYQLGVGYAIFLNQHVSIEPIISYRHTKLTNKISNNETINSGFNLGAGFTIYI